MLQNISITSNFDLTNLIVDFNQEIHSISVFSSLIILSTKFVLYESTKKMTLMSDDLKLHEEKQRKLKHTTNRNEKTINCVRRLSKILCDLIFKKRRLVNELIEKSKSKN